MKLVQLESRYSDKHPDVKKMKYEIAELEKRLRSPSQTDDNNARRTKPVYSPLDQPDNPAYVTLASQLASVQSEIESVKHQINDMNLRRKDYYRRIDASPRVEESYKSLLVERNNTQLKYDDFMKKSIEARVAQGFEKEQMGDRFTLLEPARLPEKPVSPKIKIILLIGILLGIGAGISTISIQEMTDRSIKNPKILAMATKLPVLVSIPEIVTEKDIHIQKKKRKVVLIIIVSMAVIFILIFHFFIMDIYLFWAKLRGRSII